MRKLLPVLLAILGLAGGGGAGYFLRPAPAPATAEAAAEANAAGAEAGHAEPAAAAEHGEKREYVKLNNQFVVPVVEGSRVAALVILSLSLETAPGSNEAVFSIEPKLRNAFLQVLFDHANAGGFRGNFTDPNLLDNLRRALLEAAKRELGPIVTDVLIVDIVRQDNG